MAERRSSVLAVPLSAHVHGQERKSSVSGGGLGAIRPEVLRGPANSIPSIEEEDEENENIQESNGRHLSTVTEISVTDVQAPVFRIPVFDGPGSTSPVPEQPPTAPHVITRKPSVSFGIAGPTRSISPTRQQTRESTRSSITEKSTHTARKSVLVRSRTKSFVLPAYIQEADESQKKQTRQKWVTIAFKWTYYFLCLCAIYFSLIGMPLWKGCAYWLYVAINELQDLYLGWLVLTGTATFYAFLPLLSLFDPNPPDEITDEYRGDVENTALVIPAYKSEKILPATLIAALKIFPPDHIFVICNGNSPTPLDGSENVCKQYGVNHIWVPIGSKITAEFVGAHVTSQFKYILRIDDDVILPPNLPLATHLITPKVGSVSYCIRSVGADSMPGTVVQQWQDIEYKLAGLVKQFCSRYGGSATFAHGAIVLWDREVCVRTFDHHPGYKISEDWFFGHVCRRMGKSIKSCSVVFVETETLSRFIIPQRNAERGGFGEMLVWKQRFYRWNFFLITDVWYNVMYILFSWKLGFGEIVTKIFVFQEIYEALLYLATPFVLVCSLIVNHVLTLQYMAMVLAMYLVNTIVFNIIHLRLKRAMVAWWPVFTLMVYKIALSFVNAASVYWTIWEYASYFANKHFRIIDDPKALEVVWRLQQRHSIFSPEGKHVETETVTLELFATVPAQSVKNDLEENSPHQVPSVKELRRETIARRNTMHPERGSLWRVSQDSDEPSALRRMTIQVEGMLHKKASKASISGRRGTGGA